MGDRFQGITNGIDIGKWNPETDSADRVELLTPDTSNKAACKSALQQTFGLPQRTDVPMFGMCGRLVKQKGFDILLASGALNVLDAQSSFSVQAKTDTRRV